METVYETRYGEGLLVQTETKSQEWDSAFGEYVERKRMTISINEQYLRQRVEETTLELVSIAVKNERELLAKRVREMGADGRLGMNEKQVELLAAAIEGLAEQSAEMLAGREVREDGTIHPSYKPSGIASQAAPGSVTMNVGLPPNTTGANGGV